ncbi:DNA-directed DNA polymerase alpha catalytic subunit pol1 [Saitoella coloradoensis]
MDRPSRRTNTKKNPRDRFAELRALKAAGKTRAATYEDEAEEDIYDELDEEEYTKHQRERLDEDDFIVDDNGEGYVDYGQDEFERERYSDEEDDQRPKKTAKQKKEEATQKEKKNESINKYLAKVTVPTTTKQNAAAPTVEDAEFMAGILGDFDVEDDSTAYASASRRANKRAAESSPIAAARKRRAPSPPPRAASRRMDPPMPSSPPSIQLNDTDHPMTDDNDYDMGEPIIPPSSPTPAAKKLVAEEDEEEDADDFVVKPLTAHRGPRTTGVNVSATRSVPRVAEQPNRLKPIQTHPNGAIPTSPVSAAVDASAWMDVDASLNITSSPQFPSSGSKISPEDACEENGTLRFFWIDYIELGGSLYLFGKVFNKKTQTHVSAFVRVDGILRNLYFLPRDTNQRSGEEVGMGQVWEEVSGLLSKAGIAGFKSKVSKRKYAFEEGGVPAEGDYLKVLYEYSKAQLPQELTGDSFSRVFGTNTPMFEQFVLYRRVMGPCWLEIKDADFNAVTNASWCKLELAVSDPELITTLPDGTLETPPLTIMSLAFRTMMNHAENKQEIVVASARIYENVNMDDPTPAEKLPCSTFTVVRPLKGVFPAGFETDVKKHRGQIRCEKTESALLNCFVTKIQGVDPDVYIGHGLEGVDYGVLLHRMREKKTMNWHRLGRMRRREWPRVFMNRAAGNSFEEKKIVAGRLMCDLANDLGKSTIKGTSWSLTEMVQTQLGKKREEMDIEKALQQWTDTARGLTEFVMHCEVDTYFIAAIALKTQLLPLTKQLTNLAGNSWARTLTGTRAERNEYILLHEFNKAKYICPDKPISKKPVTEPSPEDDDDDATAGTSKKKNKFAGGRVLDPIKGLYDKFVLVMDFNSLYPSIIQEYNICFTTVDRSEIDETNEDEKMPDLPDAETPQGILPKLLANLVARRRQVKSLMKDKKATPVQLAQWDTKQTALKLTANSMYGCLGFTKSRFYARPLAALVTYKGREALTSTKELAESMALQVIYGDTDSVMINTNIDNYQEAIRIGNEFKATVNGRYRLLEIDIDNVFQRLLLHMKKKYAALNLIEVNGKLESKMEVKGLDMKRREFCQLSKDASQYVLNQILSGEQTETVIEKIHEYLRELSAKMRNGDFPVNKYIIYNKLGKNPEEYPNAKHMAQVQVALKKKAKGEAIRIGDVIAYVITGEEGATQNPEDVAARAYPPQDVMKTGSDLKIDFEHYLVKQIFPPLDRLCQPIEGTDSSRLAECLGLDTRKYNIGRNDMMGSADKDIQPLETQISDEERFKDAAKLHIKCQACKESFDFEGLVQSQERVTANGIQCQCGVLVSSLSLSAQLDCQIRQQTSMYYEGWLVCEDTACGNRTRQMSVYGKRCLACLSRGARGQMRYEYSDKMMYNQMLYFDSLFDVDKARAKAKGDDAAIVFVLAEQNRERFDKQRAVIARYLERCGRRYVDLSSIFSFMG